MYQSTKTYGHEVGLSSTFRQWKADSHCKKLHGYALSIKIVFEASELDEKNWVVDFGSLKSFKAVLENTFDHKLIVAEDDPLMEHFLKLQELGGADIVVLQDVGCEAFSEVVHNYAEAWLLKNDLFPRVSVKLVEVKEHGANSAVFYKEE